ncbi:MAG TPA: helix-turn-helix transcriptional regulator [Acidimicrobiia bacterium]
MALPDRAGSERSGVVYDRKLAGRRVRHAREDHGWSRAELAHRLIGMTPEAWTEEKVKFVELGRKNIEPPLLRVFAEVLDRPADYFLYHDHPGRSRPTASKPDSRGAGAPPALAPVIPIRSKRAQRAFRPIAEQAAL